MQQCYHSYVGEFAEDMFCEMAEQPAAPAAAQATRPPTVMPRAGMPKFKPPPMSQQRQQEWQQERERERRQEQALRQEQDEARTARREQREADAQPEEPWFSSDQRTQLLLAMLCSGTFLLAVYIVVAGVYGQQKGLGFNAMIKLAGKEFLALLLNIGPVDEPEQGQLVSPPSSEPLTGCPATWESDTVRWCADSSKPLVDVELFDFKICARNAAQKSKPPCALDASQLVRVAAEAKVHAVALKQQDL
jgi:hypothetical protein